MASDFCLIANSPSEILTNLRPNDLAIERPIEVFPNSGRPYKTKNGRVEIVFCIFFLKFGFYFHYSQKLQDSIFCFINSVVLIIQKLSIFSLKPHSGTHGSRAYHKANQDNF